ncbi:MAG: SOS response-associated peptidase family protein [Sphingomonadales bacterium]|nr:SOS response-associated peptidase family protein [Sphingomonadales bacterium]
MCNRYQPGERKRITDFFDAPVLRAVNAGPSIVHPREPGWVVRMIEGAPVLEQMTWGFPVQLKGKAGQLLKPRPVNNARFDKLASFWRRWSAFPEQRCLVPATRYAEAVGRPGQMTTTWLSLKSAPIFAWAGLWSNSAEWGPVYTCVMTSCAAELAEIHDRSPVILPPEHWRTWLSAPLDQLGRFDRPWPGGDVLVTATNVPWKLGGEPSMLPDQWPPGT